MGIFDTLKDSIAGNQVIRSYAISEDYFSMGVNGLWKVYKGKSKKDNSDASVFILDKKSVNLSEDKKIKLFELFAHAVRNLQTVKHPNVIKVLMPVCETKDVLAFAAEPIAYSLNRLFDHSIENAELLLNFHQLLVAIEFIHKTFGMTVGLLTPSHIAVTSSGEWKISFLEILFQNGNKNDRVEIVKIALKSPTLFAAPEVIDQSMASENSDTFVVGALLIYIMNIQNKNFIQNIENPDFYKQNLSTLQNARAELYKSVPQPIVSDLVSCFLALSQTRPSIETLLNNKAFRSAEIVIITSIKAYNCMKNEEKASFIQSLSQIINEVSPNFLEKRVLPFFLDLLIDPNQTLNSLKAVLRIASLMDAKQYTQVIYPRISYLFDMSDCNIKLALVENFQTMMKNLPEDIIQNKLINFLKSCLSFRDPLVQASSLSVFNEIYEQKLISDMSSSIYPSLSECLIRSTTLNVQVNSIIAIANIMKTINSEFNLSDMVAHLTAIKSNETGCVMAILGALQNIFKYKKEQVDTKVIACLIIPCILKNLLLPSLNSTQVSMHFTICKRFFQFLEDKVVSSTSEVHNSPTPLAFSTIVPNTATKAGDTDLTKIPQQNFNLFNPSNTTDMFGQGFITTPTVKPTLNEMPRSDQFNSSHLFPQNPVLPNNNPQSSLVDMGWMFGSNQIPSSPASQHKILAPPSTNKTNIDVPSWQDQPQNNTNSSGWADFTSYTQPQQQPQPQTNKVNNVVQFSPKSQPKPINIPSNYDALSEFRSPTQQPTTYNNSTSFFNTPTQQPTTYNSNTSFFNTPTQQPPHVYPSGNQNQGVSYQNEADLFGSFVSAGQVNSSKQTKTNDPKPFDFNLF